LHGGRLCTRCTFSDRLAELLDDGTGQIRPELAPLVEHLLAMNNPLTGLTWLYPRRGRPGPADLLRGLGRGQIELTHEAFHTLQPWRAAAHLRELLMACGVLPPVDKQICSFERWLIGHLAGITDPDHAHIVQHFATWHVLPRLRAQAEKRPITPGNRCHAGDRVKHATDFLQWLSARDLTLPTCRQADIDAWHAQHNDHAQSSLRAFLQWCAVSRLTCRFRLPAYVTHQATPLGEHERVDLLGRVLTGSDLPLRSRVAAAIVLLYAQPLSRIVRLTIDDVIHDGNQVLLRLGEPPSPVPDPGRRPPAHLDQQQGQHEHRDQPQLTLAVPGTAGRPAAAPEDPRRPGHRSRRPYHGRTSRSDPPIRPGRPRRHRRRSSRLPPRHHRQARHAGRRDLEPLRPG
jgi:hypothetical protein